jgi:tRNA-binding EMAP/Myf-like protein
MLVKHLRGDAKYPLSAFNGLWHYLSAFLKKYLTNKNHSSIKTYRMFGIYFNLIRNATYKIRRNTMATNNLATAALAGLMSIGMLASSAAFAGEEGKASCTGKDKSHAEKKACNGKSSCVGKDAAKTEKASCKTADGKEKHAPKTEASEGKSEGSADEGKKE